MKCNCPKCEDPDCRENKLSWDSESETGNKPHEAYQHITVRSS